MQTKLTCALGLLLAVVTACSHQQPAKNLIGRLREADRVIVLNANDGASVTVTDDLLKKLVQAIAAAPRIESEGLTVTPGYTLIFFKSRVHLATVPTGSDIVLFIDNNAYAENSGTLRAVWQRFWETHPKSQ